jgi:hypothetical protein
MKRFIIERELADAGKLTREEFQNMVTSSLSAISVVGKPYTWIGSYVTENKIYCIHEAESEEVIRQHSDCANLPVTHIEEVKVTLSPETIA